MLQLRYSKLKEVFYSVIVHRFLLKDSKLYNQAATASNKQRGKIRKSTDAGNNEQQMRIIEKCFPKNVLEHVGKEDKSIGKKEVNEKPIVLGQETIITPEFYNAISPKEQPTFISKLFAKKPTYNGDLSDKDEKILEQARLQATTLKVEEEKLAQKMEAVDETPHVEAYAPKNEGFNLPPKVLGNDSFILELSKKKYEKEQSNFDELAKRCLEAPIEDVDKIIIQEMKNFNQKAHPRLDFDFNRNQYTGIPNKACNNQFQDYYERAMLKSEYRLDKIQPIHLDTTPVFKVDKGIKDYRPNALIREFSNIYFTTEVKDKVTDIPASLSPYEQPAIPFYEYINKHTAESEESKIETTAITEEQEADIIFHDELTEVNDQENREVEEIETEQPINPKPSLSQFSTLRISETKEDALLQKTPQADFYNVLVFQRSFTSSPEQPTSWFPEDTKKSRESNSAISARLTPESDSRQLDIPTNTAISANQNPDEYYKMSIPKKFVENQTSPLERLFAESPVTQNVIFSALPQELEKASVENKTDELRKDLISNLLSEKQTKDTFKSAKPEIAQKETSDSMPLSLLLKKIREQNRLEYCRDFYSNLKLEKKCPPIEKCKPKPEKPRQTQPKPCDHIKPCPPPKKKDPCAKYSPIFLTMFKCDIFLDTFQNPNANLSFLALLTCDVIQRLKILEQKFKNYSEIVFARDFDPWIPIPSWPIPKKEKEESSICPKGGCKMPMPKITKQPYKGKPCIDIPKKNLNYLESM